MQAKCLSFLCILITIYNQYCPYVCVFVVIFLKSIITVYNNMGKIMSSDIKLWQLCINAESKFIILRQMWVYVIRITVPVLELGSI